MVLKLPLHFVFHDCPYTPFRRVGFHCVSGDGQISVLECCENDAIRKRRSNYIESCSQNFVILNFISEQFSGSKIAGSRSGSIYVDVEILFQSSF
jgi:hypothetical protein